jgi:hypothetical protein
LPPSPRRILRNVGAPWLKPSRSPETRLIVLAGRPLPAVSKV